MLPTSELEYPITMELINNGGVTFASETYANAMRLEDISVGVFTKALENLATLRADNGGTYVPVTVCI